LADPTAIPIYFISGLAKANGITVVLTGDGADECFCGYRRWAKYIRLLRWFNYYTSLPKWTRKAVAAGYARHRASGPWYEVLQRASDSDKLAWGVAGFKDTTKRMCLSGGLLDRMQRDSAAAVVEQYRIEFSKLPSNGRLSSEVDWLCYHGFRSAVPDKYCYRADHLGMAHSIELRVPFLDNRMVGLSLSLPARFKLRRGISKYILKWSAERVLPKEILYRKKMGFCVPLKEWGSEIMTDYVRDNLKKFCRETGYFSESGLRTVLSETAEGNPDHVFALWNIFFLMQWFRKWLL
jgi:asparagine synthase (glutamine-hydrolysing)